MTETIDFLMMMKIKENRPLFLHALSMALDDNIEVEIGFRWEKDELKDNVSEKEEAKQEAEGEDLERD